VAGFRIYIMAEPGIGCDLKNVCPVFQTNMDMGAVRRGRFLNETDSCGAGIEASPAAAPRRQTAGRSEDQAARRRMPCR